MNRNTLIALKTKEKFIRKIAPMVQEVFCDSRGVNPSVVIAQAILESGYGTSHLAKKNNIFGLNNYHDGYLVNVPPSFFFIFFANNSIFILYLLSPRLCR